MGQNVYQTKNYFIAAYHYVQCYGTDLIIPSSTADVAQALAHYYKRAQVWVWVQFRLTSSTCQNLKLQKRTAVAHKWCRCHASVSTWVLVLLPAYTAAACNTPTRHQPVANTVGLCCAATNAGWRASHCACLEAHVPQQCLLPLP
jgi:hypothetical protein